MYVASIVLMGTLPSTGRSDRHRALELSERGNRCTVAVGADRVAEARAACAEQCDRVEEGGDGLALSCRPTRESGCVLRTASTAHLATLLLPRGLLHSVSSEKRATELVFLLRGEGPEDVEAAVREAVEATKSRLVRIRVRPLVLPPDVGASSLRQTEREALAVALKMGYYQSPRACTMDDIGRTLGITKSAVYHRLSAVESKALQALADHALDATERN